MYMKLLALTAAANALALYRVDPYYPIPFKLGMDQVKLYEQVACIRFGLTHEEALEHLKAEFAFRDWPFDDWIIEDKSNDLS